MAYWHDEDGNPCQPFKGKFDWSHLMPLIVFVGIALAHWLFTKVGSP